MPLIRLKLFKNKPRYVNDMVCLRKNPHLQVATKTQKVSSFRGLNISLHEISIASSCLGSWMISFSFCPFLDWTWVSNCFTYLILMCRVFGLSFFSPMSSSESRKKDRVENLLLAFVHFCFFQNIHKDPTEVIIDLASFRNALLFESDPDMYTLVPDCTRAGIIRHRFFKVSIQEPSGCRMEITH